jgi:hypothetical protein
MADDAKVGGGRSRTWLWMIVALVAIGGFLVWLGAASEPSAVAVAEADGGEEEDEAGEGGMTSFVEVAKDSLAANKARYDGQRVRVAQVEATGSLGNRVFWGELGDRANQVPILIRMDSAAAQGFQVQTGTLYTLTGQMNRMSDSLATVWGEAGEFAGEGEQMQAAFADYYIQVSTIRPSRGGSSGSSGEGGSDAQGG